jgi:hypothetical protein
MGARRRHRGRLGAVVAALLVTTACSAAPGPQGSGSTAGPGATAAGSASPAGPTFPPIDPTNVARGAQAEVELVHAMRADLGVAAAVGSNGDAVLIAVDAAEQAFGEAFLPEAAGANGLDLGPTGAVRLAAFNAGSTLHEWTGGDLGRASATISASLALGSEFLEQADKGFEVPGYKKDETYTSTTGDTTESVKMSSELFVKAADGKLAVDVNLTSSATLMQGGNLTGLLNGDGKGHLDIGGCPDASGNITGTIEATIGELWSSGGKTGTTDVKVTGTFTISANDAAGLAGVSAHMTTSGSGTNGAGGSWTASGTAGFGTGEAPTVTASGATQAQVDRTTGAAAMVLFTLANAANKAQEYWQSGKCVELKASPESKEVKPKEEVHVSVDAVSKTDGAQVKGPITATFSGKESLDPASGPQDAPASYTFKAGDKDGDVGTIQLEQRSRRGIGRGSVTYTVGGGLTFAATGTVTPFGFSLKLTIPTTRLVLDGDHYSATVPVTITGKFATEGCETRSISYTSSATVYVTIDEKDPTLAHVSAAAAASMNAKTVTTICAKYPATFPVPAATWFVIFVSGGSVPTATIGVPTKLSAAPAQGTVTIARVKPT